MDGGPLQDAARMPEVRQDSTFHRRANRKAFARAHFGAISFNRPLLTASANETGIPFVSHFLSFVICSAYSTTQATLRPDVVPFALRETKMADKDYNLQVRITQTEKESLTEAAQIAGLSLSSWIRDRLRRAVRQELQSAGRKVPFLEERRNAP